MFIHADQARRAARVSPPHKVAGIVYLDDLQLSWSRARLLYRPRIAIGQYWRPNRLGVRDSDEDHHREGGEPHAAEGNVKSLYPAMWLKRTETLKSRGSLRKQRTGSYGLGVTVASEKTPST